MATISSMVGMRGLLPGEPDARACSAIVEVAAKNASLPVILLENGYTEKNANEIYHNHLIKDFIGIEKIVLQYL